MRRWKLFLVAALIAVTPMAFAAGKLVFTAEASPVMTFGDTRYLMEEPGDPYGVSSELVFPLDTLLAGARFRLEPSIVGRRSWAVQAELFTNLRNPVEIMQDWDWYMFSGTPKVPFSYTESKARLRWYMARAEAELSFLSGEWGRLAARAGYRFQFISQDINDYNGWQYLDISPVDGQFELYGVNGSGSVLTYWVMYHCPTAGLIVTLEPIPGLSVQAEAGGAVGFVSDEDDHQVRYKLSTASGIGYGWYAGLEIRYTWAAGAARAQPYIAYSANVLSMQADTKQTQTYYAGATEEPPGTTFSGIDHVISTLQYGLRMSVGVRF